MAEEAPTFVLKLKKIMIQLISSNGVCKVADFTSKSVGVKSAERFFSIAIV